MAILISAVFNVKTFRALLNLASGTVGSVVGMVLGLVTTPLIIKYIGDLRFGTYRVLLEVMGYVGLLQVGLYGGLLSNFVEAHAKTDRTEKHAIIRVATRYYLWIVGISIIVGLTTIPFIDLLIDFPPDLSEEVVWSMLILILSLVVIPLQLSQAYLEADQKGYVVHLSNVGQSIFYSLSALGFAYFQFCATSSRVTASPSFLLAPSLPSIAVPVMSRGGSLGP